MQRWIIVAGMAILAVVVFVTAQDDLRVAIRATARTSALCIALAFARIQVKEMSVLLPVSHAAHYALILAAGLWEPIALVAGIAIYAIMVWNAIRPNAPALYVVWIAFLVAIGINSGRGLIYPVMTALLLLAGAVRWVRRPQSGGAAGYNQT